MTFEIYLVRHGDPLCILGTVEAANEREAEVLAKLTYDCDGYHVPGPERRQRHTACGQA